MATIPASENEYPEVLLVEGAAPAAPATGIVKLYAKADGLPYAKDDAGAESPMTPNAHIADTADAHDASAISFDPTGAANITATEVQGALDELDAAIAGGGIPATIFDAQGDLIVASAADTAARLALGASGEALVSNGTTAVWGRPKGTPVDHGHVRYTAGDITCDADSVWEALGISDITLTAASGDVVEVGVQILANNTTAVSLNFDVATIVAGSPVNSLGSGGAPSDSNDGVAGWRIAGSANGAASGSIMYTLQAGDISGGTVTLQVRDRPASSTNRVVAGTTAQPIHFWAKNLGPTI